MKKITNASLLRFFLSYPEYQKFHKYVNTDWLNPEARTILEDFEEYYTKYQQDIDLEAFIGWFHQVKHTDLPKTKREEYNLILESVANADLEKIQDIIEKFQEESTKDQIREAIEKKLSPDTIRNIVLDYESKIRALDEEIQGESSMDLEDFWESGDRSHGLKFRLDCLNKGLSGLVAGDMIIVAAFVDGGKTIFSISEATFMAQQLVGEECVAWFNNEEPDKRVKYKIYSSMLSAPVLKVRNNWKQAKKAYLKKVGGFQNRIRFFDMRGKGVRYIEQVCEKYKPRLIILDQIDKMKGGGYSKDGAEHIRIKNLYGDVRDRIAKYAPVLAVSQCDATTRWKDKETMQVQYQRIIDQTQLDGSKVGKPGEADAIITIGQDVRFPGSRYISICKNKMEGIDENYRHLRGYEVGFNGELCQYINPIHGDNDHVDE